MALAMRVACDEEVDGNGGKSDGDEGGGQGTAMREMATEGKQQSTGNGIDKGGRWLAREHQRGNHTTTTVGNDEGREPAADDDGSDKEGEGEKGNGDGNEGGGRQRGRGRRREGWHWRQGWRATKRAMATATRAMATRVMGVRWRRGRW